MTKKDFELIARTIKALPMTATRREVAEEFAVALAVTNGRFKRERFIDACLREFD